MTVYGCNNTIKTFIKSELSQVFNNNISNKKFMTNLCGKTQAPAATSYEALLSFMPDAIEKGLYPEETTTKAPVKTPAKTVDYSTLSTYSNVTVPTTKEVASTQDFKIENAPKAESKKSIYDIDPKSIQTAIAQSTPSEVKTAEVSSTRVLDVPLTNIAKNESKPAFDIKMNKNETSNSSIFAA